MKTKLEAEIPARTGETGDHTSMVVVWWGEGSKSDVNIWAPILFFHCIKNRKSSLKTKFEAEILVGIGDTDDHTWWEWLAFIKEIGVRRRRRKKTRKQKCAHAHPHMYVHTYTHSHTIHVSYISLSNVYKPSKQWTSKQLTSTTFHSLCFYFFLFCFVLFFFIFFSFICLPFIFMCVCVCLPACLPACLLASLRLSVWLFIYFFSPILGRW